MLRIAEDLGAGRISLADLGLDEKINDSVEDAEEAEPNSMEDNAQHEQHPIEVAQRAEVQNFETHFSIQNLSTAYSFILSLLPHFFHRQYN